MIEKWRTVHNTLRPHSARGANSRLAVDGCDVDFLIHRGTRTRAGQDSPLSICNQQGLPTDRLERSYGFVRRTSHGFLTIRIRAA